MKRDIQPIDLKGVRTYPLAERLSRVTAASCVRSWTAGGSFAAFLDSLPDMLAAADLKAVIAAIAAAHQNKRPVIFGMGAHVIKVGLGPLVVDLITRGVITGVAMNGAGMIHDTELAALGQTSEEVGPALNDGSFGMAADTSAIIAGALEAAGTDPMGLGRAVGRALLASAFPFSSKSILASGAREEVPVTIHVAIGTDIIHMHPGFNAAKTGAASHIDFRILAAQVADLEGGVYINAGSAVVLPEVFLKAVSLARNLGHRLDAFTTVNLDFMRHYRPTVNVVQRPTALGGRGFNLIGHHEIMLPLIAAGVIEKLS
jgi:hypothetical protein